MATTSISSSTSDSAKPDISREIALRIALAAHELPDTDPQQLIAVLIDLLEQP